MSTRKTPIIVNVRNKTIRVGTNEPIALEWEYGIGAQKRTFTGLRELLKIDFDNNFGRAKTNPGIPALYERLKARLGGPSGVDVKADCDFANPCGYVHISYDSRTHRGIIV